MKTFLKIVFAPLLWLINSCSPLGNPVDEKKSDSHYYNKQKSDINYSPMGNWFELANTPMNADVSSFKVLTRYLATDKHRAYFMQHPIAEGKVDLKTFHAKEGFYMSMIGLDRNHVYQFSKEYGAEIKSIVPVKIEGADPATYEAIDYLWAKDDENFFYRQQKVPVDYNSFETLGESFSRDKDSIYYHALSNFKSISADIGSFKILHERYYAMDRNTVFVNHYTGNEEDTHVIPIPIAPGETVRLLNEAYVQIGARIFYGAEPVDLDASTTEIIGTYYIKDHKKVFYQDQWLQDADPQSFSTIGDFNVGDKKGVFRGAERVSKN